VKLTRLERVKSELKQLSYEYSKFSGIVFLLKINNLHNLNVFWNVGPYLSKYKVDIVKT
jgi:hypothetical protein